MTESVFETSTESFSPTDLTQFQQTYGLTVQAANDVGGQEVTTCNTNSFGNTNGGCYEGNLDIQYIMGMAQVTTATYYYVSSSDPFNTYLANLGDMTNPIMVNSISWGSYEEDYTSSQLDTFNNEAIALANMGVTIMVSSGDDGVSGSSCQCDVSSGSSTLPYAPAGGANYTGEGYFPSFPATSPYVTAVGATQGPNFGLPPIACQSNAGGVITTGGGFSSYYAAPSWQTDAISTFFASTVADGNSPSSGYNPLVSRPCC